MIIIDAGRTQLRAFSKGQSREGSHTKEDNTSQPQWLRLEVDRNITSYLNFVDHPRVLILGHYTILSKKIVMVEGILATIMQFGRPSVSTLFQVSIGQEYTLSRGF